MTRTQTAAASLVAAIPAGILGALLVMVFLNHAENLKLMTQLLVGGTLAVTTAIALTPFAVLILGGKKPAGKAAAKAGVAMSDDDGDLVEASGEIMATGDEDEDTETVVYQTNDDDDEVTDDLLDAGEFGDDTDDDLILSDDDVDTVAEEDEPPAKKKKGKM